MAEVGANSFKHHDERFQDLPCLGADLRSRQLSCRRVDAGSAPDPDVFANLGDVFGGVSVSTRDFICMLRLVTSA
jgi:hypothetical protein